MISRDGPGKKAKRSKNKNRVEITQSGGLHSRIGTIGTMVLVNRMARLEEMTEWDGGDK